MLNKKKITDYLVYLIPGLIVCVIILSIFFVKHLYPFSNVASLQIDADYNYVPTLFKIYDIFHYGDSLLWDFKLGGGSNIYGSLVMNSIYSPLNWLVIFCKRENMVNFFNILLIIKFAFMSITMFFFLKKNFSNVRLFWQIIFSLLYVFSGWGFLMYSNIFYIDIAIMFPIVIHFLIKLFKQGKFLGFIFSLSFCLILNFYLSYMIYLFIIFSSFFALFLFVEKEKRKIIISRLSFSLIFPLIISSFASLPTAIQVLSSFRNVSSNMDGYFYYFFLKVIYLTMASLPMVFFAKGLKNNSKIDGKVKLFYIMLFVMTSIGIFFEPINRIWHTGSYNSFPYRYSFITIFVIICGGIHYISTLMENDNGSCFRYRDIFLIVFFCEFVIIVFFNKFNDIITKEMIAFDVSKPGIFITLLVIFALLCIIYNNLLKISNKKVQKILISIFLCFEIGIYSNWCFNDYGYNQSSRALEYEKNLYISNDSIYKYIDYQASLGVNSSYIIRMPSLSNWLHIIPQKQHDFMEKFGYAYSNSLIYGYGGTILTDSLIGAKYFYSKLELPSDIFSLIKKSQIEDEMVYLYEFKYPMSFGLKYDDRIALMSFDSPFDFQNYYCKRILGFDYDIINVGIINIGNGINKYIINNNEPVVLYFDVTDDLLNEKIERIMVNGESISLGNSKKIVYLGEYNKSIEIEIEKSNNEDNKLIGLKYGYIKLSDYKKFLNKIKNEYNTFEFKKNRLHINIDSDDDKYLFLPINNIDGWSVKNNGKTINVYDELYTYMSIKLEKGNNEIEMEFNPPLLKESTLISIISLVLLIIYCFFEKKIVCNKFFHFILIPIYYIVSVCLLIYVYIISNFIY